MLTYIVDNQLLFLVNRKKSSHRLLASFFIIQRGSNDRTSPGQGDVAAGGRVGHQRHPQARALRQHLPAPAEHQPAHLHQPHHPREHPLLHRDVRGRLQGRRQEIRRHNPLYNRKHELRNALRSPQ